MTNRDPICPACGSDALTVVAKRSGSRWSIRATCRKCNNYTFIMDADLRDGIERLPHHEPEQQSLAITLPPPRQRYEY